MTRVLVIDDEAPIRLLCRVNLEAEKMEVLEAADGPTGLEQARAAGSSKAKLDPRPSADSTQIRPPMAVTSPCAMNRPRPVPERGSSPSTGESAR